jgi:large subunit ribosomal protein L25
MISLDPRDVMREASKAGFFTRLYDIEVAGKTHRVLPRDVQFHPVNDKPEHIDFQRVDADREIHIRVPFHFVNAEISQAVKFGGAIVSHVMNDVEIGCLPKDLPEFIEVDLKDISDARGSTLADGPPKGKCIFGQSL